LFLRNQHTYWINH